MGKRFEGVSEGRRRNMQANKATDTQPELILRRMLHSRGYRYRIHCKTLPGKPDIVFTSRRTVVEVRGCFWHGHGCHPLGQVPKTRPEYWVPKIAATKARDQKHTEALVSLGWHVMEVWECDIRADPDRVFERLVRSLGPPGSTVSVRGDMSATHLKSFGRCCED